MIRTTLLVVTCLFVTHAATAGDNGGEYAVGPSDVLTIAVWRHPDLSGTFTVAADGAVTVPLLGRVSVSGKTLREVEAVVASQLAGGFVRDPQVTVSMQAYQSQHIYVTGEVRHPGALTLSGPLTVLEALARAGSVTEYAGAEAVIARPVTPGTSSQASPRPATADLIRVDIARLQGGDLEQNVLLRDGDTLLVPRASMVHVIGEVKRPGDYPILASTTVVEIVSRAGGATERGSVERVRIIRMVNGKKTQRSAAFEDTLQPGDVVVVRERLF